MTGDEAAPTSGTALTITQHPDRFEIAGPEGTRGRAFTVDRDDVQPPRRVVYSVVTEPAFRHQGVAGQLTTALFQASSEQGYRVVPVCPYVKHFVGEHPDWAGDTATADPQDLLAVDRARGAGSS